MTKVRVYISGRDHPHAGESGTLTGKVIRLDFSEPMYEVAIDDCRHGTGGCFAELKDLREERRGPGANARDSKD